MVVPRSVDSQLHSCLFKQFSPGTKIGSDHRKVKRMPYFDNKRFSALLAALEQQGIPRLLFLYNLEQYASHTINGRHFERDVFIAVMTAYLQSGSGQPEGNTLETLRGYIQTIADNIFDHSYALQLHERTQQERTVLEANQNLIRRPSATGVVELADAEASLLGPVPRAGERVHQNLNLLGGSISNLEPSSFSRSTSMANSAAVHVPLMGENLPVNAALPEEIDVHSIVGEAVSALTSHSTTSIGYALSGSSKGDDSDKNPPSTG